MQTINVKEINSQMTKFIQERDWGQFHSIKNLSMALSVEVSELVEIFQWVNEDESNKISKKPDLKKKVEEEIADIFLYLLQIANKAEVNIEEAALSKIEQNAKKYPIHKSKGNATKYDKL